MKLRDIIVRLVELQADLPDWERGFVASIARQAERDGGLTPAQTRKAVEILKACDPEIIQRELVAHLDRLSPADVEAAHRPQRRRPRAPSAR